ncbi:MAG: G8 domain-containing protein [Planctomycetaceae bacterium]
MLRKSVGILCLQVCSTISAADIGQDLCPPEIATHRAVQSGSWQDTTTWSPGIPPAGAKVLIPAGMTVTNHATTEDVLWIHVAGVLTVCDHCDTQINVHTIYVPMGGAVRLGMPTMPCAGKTVLEFVPGSAVRLDGPFLPGDWQKLSLGVLCHGEFMACGQDKSAWLDVDGDLVARSNSLKLSGIPYRWQVGDQLLVAGTDASRDNPRATYQSEFVTITAVTSRTITFSPRLNFRHFRWRNDLPFHVANLTRNVVIRSRDTSAINNRGHLMFMTSMNDIRYTKIEGLGRTDKSKPATDPRKDTSGNLIPGSDENPRARYADHNHRTGPMNAASRRMWNVVEGSPGWGMVNHASNCEWDNCIVIRTFGSGFVTEEGQERGAMRRCLAALNKGQGDSVVSSDSDHGRFDIGDWGTDGSGFWLQGGLVDVVDCVSFDNSGRGFALFNQPLNHHPDYGGIATWIRYPIEVDKSLLPVEFTQTPWWQYKASIGQTPTGIPSGFVPQRVFSRNTAYNCKIGLQSWFIQDNNAIASRTALPAATRGRISDLTLWGRGNTLGMEYTRQFTIDGLKIVGDHLFRGRYQTSTNFGTPASLRFRDMTITRLSIDGCLNRDNWPNPSPIQFLGNADVLPTIKIDGLYPIVNGNAGTTIR